MMCEVKLDTLQQLMDEELLLHEKTILLEHLKACRECKKQLNQLKLLDWELSHREIEIPEELLDRRKKAVQECFAEISTPQRGFLKKQKKSLGHSLGYIRHIPGIGYLRVSEDAFASAGRELGKRFKKKLLGRIMGR